MEQYWSERFRKQGKIWGTEPSPTALAAAALFREAGIAQVLVPGAGYGRNTKAFSREFRTEALELSPEAVRLGREWDPLTDFRMGSVLDRSAMKGKAGGIFAYDILHLFLEGDRRRLMGNLLHWLEPGGLVYATCFSDEDSHYGTGRCLEPGTYEYTPGKYAHFFSEEDLREHFRSFQILSLDQVDETLRYEGGGSKQYRLRIIAARKPRDL
ncbi:bifunctional 2-polyprenyl-6-hydroxyphenol methylase/3-demethylubiquinol 3-O-methyltransferase UbiG [Paenibacillus sp. YN15]|uniref:class I SAM-dependent methyltransferase n=1 Tax=Paenibacillus sp. YN15 TaxID=1742774 RepID=UPI000DCAEF1D|nr:class I SAM-dependent methyltransferase [Paenibacillus sp. YN15]RAV01748.1 class I SAM-dependent methyltransferase [Paenibacillus sp. YN15]